VKPAKHKHSRRIPLADARDIIQRLADTKTLTQDDERLVTELEERTGVSLAELTKAWGSRG
jgi:hypothetical protein